MIVIGIESATKTGGVAVLSETEVLAERTSNIEVTHSERLMAMVEQVLGDAGLSLAEVSGFCVSAGPGSFTGLRIGIATAQGLAFATGKPVVPVSTLKALAWNVRYAGVPVCPLLDAKKDQVYAAIFRTERGMVQEIMAADAISLRDLVSRIAGPTVFTGEASVLFRDDIAALCGDRALFASHSAVVPSASSVAEIGMALLLAGEQVEPELLAPTYIRRPEAEIAWEKRQRSR